MSNATYNDGGSGTSGDGGGAGGSTRARGAKHADGHGQQAAAHPGTDARRGGFDSHAISTDTRTDEQLLSGYRAGDKNAFATLVGRYQRELFHFLVRFLGDRAAAEDVFQETFLQVHQSIEQFDPQRRFRPWLFTIAATRRAT